MSSAAEPFRPGLAPVSNLRRDAGCGRAMNWRCDLPTELDGNALEAHLVRAGYESRCRHPALKVLRHQDGHELAWVLRSGRVQIRVPIFVEAEKREGFARAVYVSLIDAVGSLEPYRDSDQANSAADRPVRRA